MCDILIEVYTCAGNDTYIHVADIGCADYIMFCTFSILPSPSGTYQRW